MRDRAGAFRVLEDNLRSPSRDDLAQGKAADRDGQRLGARGAAGPSGGTAMTALWTAIRAALGVDELILVLALVLTTAGLWPWLGAAVISGSRAYDFLPTRFGKAAVRAIDTVRVELSSSIIETCTERM